MVFNLYQNQKSKTADDYFGMPGSPMRIKKPVTKKQKNRRNQKLKPTSRSVSRSNSFVSDSRRNSFIPNDPDGTLKSALTKAEEEGDFKELSDIIESGQGSSLIPLKSKNEDVQDFLNQVPRHLVGIHSTIT